jgi:hypothetical protein
MALVEAYTPESLEADRRSFSEELENSIFLVVGI